MNYTIWKYMRIKIICYIFYTIQLFGTKHVLNINYLNIHDCNVVWYRHVVAYFKSQSHAGL